MSVLQTQRNRHEEALLSAFTNGVKPDALLFRQEIRVQQAWAQGLCDLGVLTHLELKSIDQALNAAFELMTEGTFDWREEDEDIHMNLERFVNEKTQGLGKKMHLGRSRNDLISTTLKLHVADTCFEVNVLVGKMIEGLVSLAKNNLEVLIPGMTHQQNGQPVRWSQVLLGHAWSLHRDQVRLMETKNSSLEAMPLGSAALAGTSLSIDLESMAKTLGFKSAPQNSYDAVGDRDSVVQIMQNFSLLGAHLSRLAEDCIYWASAPVGLIQLPPAWSTGSSIMPNKRNPDVAELVRGKASLWMGEASGVLTLLKGMPTSYGSDLHESKIPYLNTSLDVKRSLEVFKHFIVGLTPSKNRAEQMLMAGHILATEIADHLASQGVPFREAYGQVAALVEVAELKNIQCHEISEVEALKLAPGLKPGFMNTLSFNTAVEKRSNAGGTSLKSVLEQIEKLSTLY